jgi:uncharacterized protein (TIGR03086 family)
MVSEIADRYRRRADTFEAKVAAVRPEQWSNRSPCDEWDARGVVGHIVDMHGVMLRDVDRSLDGGRAVEDDPLAAFRAARAAVEAVLDDPESSAVVTDTPAGRVTVAEHVDRVVSEDMVIHGWDLARATGQDDTIDPDEVARMWPAAQNTPPEMRIPGHYGPGIVVFGPEVPVPEDAPLQDRLIGKFGRNPGFSC